MNGVFLFLVAFLALLSNASAQNSRSEALSSQARTALSQTSGNLKVGGLQQPVTVLRDKWGVAHIYAQNQHDLFFAQGFVAAQDRLFQMELWKRAGQGRLAEVLGPSATERDRYARLLRYRGDMKAEYSSYAPDAFEILQAFTDGINAYIRNSRTLPIEFKLSGFAPEPWRPEDCLSRMAAFSVTANATNELKNAAMLAVLGPEKSRLLLGPDPDVQLDPVPGVDMSWLSADLLKGMIGGDARIEFPADHNNIGSNNWTISGKLTASGKPLLANDPHRVIAVPSLRYIVHLVAPGWDVIGSGEPALPGVSIGHNRSIAWGLTIFPVDQQDLYLEELNPADPMEYKSGDHWEKFRSEQTTIAIKGGSPVTLTLKFTGHGPLLWEDDTHHHALSLRWVGSEPGTAGYLASLSLDRSTNWDEFLNAMQRWKLPPENMVYADTQGNIGEQSAGLTPVRSWTGLLPVPDDAKHEWSGFVPLDQLPRSFNPAQGFIATANHKTIPENYKYKVGYSWSPFRVHRIREALQESAQQQHKFTVADMQALQNDVVSLPARELIALLPEIDDPWVKLLRAWDNRLTPESQAGAIYEVWQLQVQQAVAGKIAGSAARITGPVGPQQALDYLRQGSLPAADRNQLLLHSLVDAIAQLKKLEGPDSSKWSWGRLHTIVMRHSLDLLPAAKSLVDLGPISRPGDGNTVNATGGSDFKQSSGASYREIFDLSDWDNSLAINTPGQSGQPGSPHYCDLLQMWSEGKYFPLLYSRERVEVNATEKLTLEP
ncbi:MAG TPA: penicillin acylase family protein [Candidatus Angelobacter sp.]|jgi:penicillin amidase|nr:penicillin acylase family protein [Candidatus Angelobacter sp.]